MQTNISIAICDDEPNDRNEMESMTKELLEAEKGFFYVDRPSVQKNVRLCKTY